MEYVYPFLPRCGLGNLLFPWARCVAYSLETQAQMIAPIWARMTRIGPWIRGERYKRYYGGDFTNNGYITGFKKWWLLHFQKTKVHVEYGMEGFFEPFICFQAKVYAELLRIVNPEIIKKCDDIVRCDRGKYVAVHVRRGDFTQAGCKTEDDWFVRSVAAALELDEAKDRGAVRIFSDGYPDELSFLTKEFKSENIIIMPKAPAIQDILMLARSKVLVCSPRSTFSMWGVFLGQMPSVWKKGEDVKPPRLYVKDSREIYVS